MWVTFPGWHSTVIWFSVLLEWSTVGTVLFVLELKILEGMGITVPIPLTWDDWNQIRGMVARSKKVRMREHHFGEMAVS